MKTNDEPVSIQPVTLIRQPFHAGSTRAPAGWAARACRGAPRRAAGPIVLAAADLATILL